MTHIKWNNQWTNLHNSTNTYQLFYEERNSKWCFYNSNLCEVKWICVSLNLRIRLEWIVSVFVWVTVGRNASRMHCLELWKVQARLSLCMPWRQACWGGVVSGQLHALATLPRDRTPGIHRTGGRVHPQASIRHFAEDKNLLPLPGITPWISWLCLPVVLVTHMPYPSINLYHRLKLYMKQIQAGWFLQLPVGKLVPLQVVSLQY